MTQELHLICSLRADDTDEFFEELRQVSQLDVEMIEIRLDDYYAGHTLLQVNGLIRRIASQSGKKLLWTLRTDQDPSRFSDEAYNYLLRMLDKDGRFYDIEINRIDALDFAPDFSRVVLSYHNFERIPEDIDQIIARMASFHPCIVKAACAGSDMDRIASFIEAFEPARSSQTIGIIMSEAGYFLRLFYQAYGFDYTFCSYRASMAPGQLSYEQMQAFARLARQE